MEAKKVGEQTVALIRTKLKRPRISINLIERVQLLEYLNRGLSVQMTLLVAPAGYGKTTLAVNWLDSLDLPSAWLSLSENDNDILLFVRYLVAALQSVAPDAFVATEDLLYSEYLPDVDAIASILINDISDLRSLTGHSGFLLALDDYHAIRNPDIHRLLSTLMRHQPHQLHLVLLSRMDPILLPIVQLRASSQIQEVRLGDLRFDRAETHAFFDNVLPAKLPDRIVDRLDSRIEGWAAGLQLASLSIRAADDLELSARQLLESPTFVADYLLEEVITHQPEAVQDFLLKTSILDQLCDDLCESITLQRNTNGVGQAFLDALSHTNAFVMPLDEHQRWYRYHQLFRNLLLNRLKASATSLEIDEYHRRASRWYAQEGFVEEAIRYALLGNDEDTAVALVEENSQDLLNGLKRQTLERWLGALPEERVLGSPLLLSARAWMLLRQWRMHALDNLLNRIEALICGESTGPSERLSEEAALLGPMQAMRSMTAYTISQDFELAVSAGRDALAQLPDSADAARGVGLVFTVLALQALGQQESALVLLGEAMGRFGRTSPAKTQVYIANGMFHRNEADISSLEAATDQFLAHASMSTDPNAPVGANWLAGVLRYELSDLDRAFDHFSQAWTRRYHSNLMPAVTGGLGIVRIHQLHGELEPAQDLLDRIRSIAHQVENQLLLRDIEAHQAEQWLLTGETLAALRWMNAWLGETHVEPLFKLQLRSLAAARIAAAVGEPGDKRAMLNCLHAVLSMVQSRHSRFRSVQVLAHIALIEESLGENEGALTHLAGAISLAEPGGLTRSVIDGGPRLQPLLQTLAQRGIAPTYITHLLAVEPWSVAKPHVGRSPVVQPNLATHGFDTLTRREAQVLRLLRTGMSNQEIARELIITVSTVKRHTSNIYNKLDVHNRMEAVRKAEALGILPT